MDVEKHFRKCLFFYGRPSTSSKWLFKRRFQLVLKYFRIPLVLLNYATFHWFIKSYTTHSIRCKPKPLPRPQTSFSRVVHCSLGVAPYHQPRAHCNPALPPKPSGRPAPEDEAAKTIIWRGLATHVFPHFAPVTCIYFERSLVRCVVAVVIRNFVLVPINNLPINWL